MAKQYLISPEFEAANPGLAFFKPAADASPLLMAVVGYPDFRLHYANPRAAELLGFNRDGSRESGRFLLDQMEPSTAGDLLTRLDGLKPDDVTQQSVTETLNIKGPGEMSVDLKTVFTVFSRKAGGGPDALMCVGEDVSQRVRQEKRSLRIEQLMKIAEENFRFGKWEFELGTRQYFWTDGIFDILEIDDEGIRKNFSLEDFVHLLPEQSQQDLFGLITQLLENKVPYSYETWINLPLGDPKRLRLFGKPILDDSGQVAKIIGITWDITEEYQVKDKLKKHLFQLSDAEQLLKFGTWEWNIEQGMVKWSDNFWNLLGYPEEERSDDWMPVERFYSHIDPEDKPEARSRETQNAAWPEDAPEVRISEFRARTHDQSLRYFLSSTRILERDSEGKPLRAIGYSADITDMKFIQMNLENKVAELKRAYEEAEQFAYVASHDLQEPLRKVTSFGERLKDRCGSGFDEDCAHYLDRMMDATARMRVLIDQLLDLSRIKRAPDQFTPTDLGQIVGEALNNLEMMVQEKQAVVQLTGLPVIEGIPFQLRQLFQNLIHNALKFARSGAVPHIRIDASEPDARQAERLNLDPFIRYLLICISDNGIGFEPQYADEIFTPFKKLHTRSEYEGTGIGLAICKKVVQNHKGALWAESTPGEGARFYIALPISQHRE